MPSLEALVRWERMRSCRCWSEGEKQANCSGVIRRRSWRLKASWWSVVKEVNLKLRGIRAVVGGGLKGEEGERAGGRVGEEKRAGDLEFD